MSYLKINNVFKSYDQKKVLNNISLDIEEGEFLCLLGPSGYYMFCLLYTSPSPRD